MIQAMVGKYRERRFSDETIAVINALQHQNNFTQNR
jgi:hypothetical protein